MKRFRQNTSDARIGVVLTFLAGIIVTVAISCAHLAPGADPLVVRCEQVETNAASTLNLVVTIDSSARPFFESNAPGFHTFAEMLRRPVIVNGTNFPMGLGVIAGLDSIKRDYEASKASSNSLYSAIVSLESLMTQGSQWLGQITNKPTN